MYDRVLLILSVVSIARCYQEWMNCSRMNCHCIKSLDCYNGEPGVCMRLFSGETQCRFCPLHQGLMYHLPEEPLPEGTAVSTLCVPVATCRGGRCFDGICVTESDYPTHGCRCRDGFAPEQLSVGVAKCVDIDECRLNRTVCPKHSNCFNTVGSFECRCLNGFRAHFDEGLYCDDVDECVTIGFDACPWYMNCLNVEGSFRCANILQEWISNETFIIASAIILLLIINVVVCLSCRQARRSLGIEDRLEVRKNQKQIDKYCVARL